MWAGLPPEFNSAGFWFGAGAGTFFASAAELEALAGMLAGLIGGHEAVAAALGTSWADPTGELAIASNQPYVAWVATLVGMLHEAAAAITVAGESFEASKAATPTPLEVQENQVEHKVLQATNFLGINTAAIIANRFRYFADMWVRAATNMYNYAAASAGSVQAIPPVPPPPPSGIPLNVNPSGALAAEKPIQQAMQGAEAPAQTVMPLLSQLGQLPSQLGQVAQAPTQLVQGLGSLPQQALQPFTSLISQFGSAGGDPMSAFGDAAASNWMMGAPAAGGPVSASLSGGGGVGGGGFGGASGAAAALRGPVSWSSTVNAAGPSAAESATPLSRIAEARAASTMPAGASGMGASGMMAPMMAGHAAQAAQDKSESSAPTGRDVFSAAADFYRAPENVPVVTGAGGAQFVTGEEDR